MNRFEQVSSDGHQMLLAGQQLGTGPVGVPCFWGEGVPILGGLYSEVQCIIGNGYMGSPPWTE